MRNALGILLAVVFVVLGLLHLYWAAGGRLASGVTVPVVGGRRPFNPSPAGTVLVAVAFLIATFIILGRVGKLGDAIPVLVFRLGTLCISVIFLLRAVGEFRLVGFFKRVRDTPFAYWDTWLFSPLCLVIAVIAFVLAYTKTGK
ncbi:MAG TPA: DUF3995 domain-containing protein [Pyrinomonadaceae bacterium]|jgi:hypothetical protein|nr:DUF3995 domain-containing protein [Pyrinomonadaceae bacterium]